MAISRIDEPEILRTCLKLLLEGECKTIRRLGKSESLHWSPRVQQGLAATLHASRKHAQG